MAQKKSSAKQKGTKKAVSKKQKGPSGPNFWSQHVWEGLILLLLPFVLYGTTVGFDYVLDDKIVLSENAFVQEGFSGMADIFQTESFTGYLQEQQDLVAGARYRPLSLATFAFEYELFGLNPAVSHFVNVLLYALTCLLLFRVFHQLVAVRKGAAWWSALPFVAALLFLAHPVHSEVVANIKGRDEILALLLSLATFYYVFQFLRSRNLVLMGLASALFFLAILAKENSLTFLGVIPLALILFTKIPQQRYIQILGPLGAVVVIYLLVRVDVIGYLFSGKEVTALMNNPFVEATTGEKFATITYTLGRYLGLSFFPHPLTHDYYPYHIPIVSWGNLWVLVALVAHLALVGIAIWQWNKSKIITFSIGLYLMTLFITSNIPFPVGTFMNERFLFMPSVGVCLALAYVLLRILPRLQSSLKMVGVAIAALFVVGFGVKTIARVPAWENEKTLNVAAIEVSVNSARANQYYGYSLYREYVSVRDSARANGESVNRDEQYARLDEALPHVKKALEIHPSYTDALTCKGGIMAGYIELGSEMEFVMDEFYQVATAPVQVPFNDAFLRYANGKGVNYDGMAGWYYRVGYQHWWEAKRDAALAKKYLELGLRVAPNDPDLLTALAQVNSPS